MEKMRWYTKKVEKSLNRINAFIEIYFICIHFFCARCFLLSARLICACDILYHKHSLSTSNALCVFFFSSLLVSSEQNRINLIVLCDVYNFAFNVIAASFFGRRHDDRFVMVAVELVLLLVFIGEWTWITGTEVLLRRVLYSWEWKFSPLSH